MSEYTQAEFDARVQGVRAELAAWRLNDERRTGQAPSRNDNFAFWVGRQARVGDFLDHLAVGLLYQQELQAHAFRRRQDGRGYADVWQEAQMRAGRQLRLLQEAIRNLVGDKENAA